MTLIFRSARNALNWEKKYLKNHPWLGDGEIQADPLKDFNTDDNTFSIWIINRKNPDIERLIAALASKKGRLDEYNFILFDSTSLDELDVIIKKEQGKSADPEVNSWHRDVCSLSAQKIVELVKSIITNDNITAMKIPPGDVADYIAKSISEGWIEQEKVNKGILADPIFISSLNTIKK